MPMFVDLTGEKFGRLIAKFPVSSNSGHVQWLCECTCGNKIITSSNSLRRGRTKSCGCLRKERAASQAKKAGDARGQQMLKHGLHNLRLYKVWKGMRQRCSNPNNEFYSNYGGRGISVCNEWNDFENFYKWAMKNGYDSTAPFGQCTIDRIDNDKGYDPSNCRWTNLSIQANNRRKRNA